MGYIVAYETAQQDESKFYPKDPCDKADNNSSVLDYSKQVKQRVTDRFLFIHNLEERVTYTFSVRAQTIDYGPAVLGNVTTGPQKG